MNTNLTVGELKELIKDLYDNLGVSIPIYDNNGKITGIKEVSDVSVITFETLPSAGHLCLSASNLIETYDKLTSKLDEDDDKGNIVSLVVKPLR